MLDNKCKSPFWPACLSFHGSSRRLQRLADPWKGELIRFPCFVRKLPPEGPLGFATREGPFRSLAVHGAEWNFPRLLPHMGALACPCWLPGCNHLWVRLLAPGLCPNLDTLLGQTEHGQLSFLTLSPKFF